MTSQWAVPRNVCYIAELQKKNWNKLISSFKKLLDRLETLAVVIGEADSTWLKHGNYNYQLWNPAAEEKLWHSKYDCKLKSKHQLYLYKHPKLF